MTTPKTIEYAGSVIPSGDSEHPSSSLYSVQQQRNSTTDKTSRSEADSSAKDTIATTHTDNFVIFDSQSQHMQKLTLDSHFEKYERFEELPESDQQLMIEARKAADDAYAPYSHFHVGAAVLLDSGVIVRGNNQENAAYPSGLCAERVALFATGAQHPNVKIAAIAITAYPEGKKIPAIPISPCGDCRQVMAEYELRYNQKIRLIMEGGNGTFIVSDSVAQLLPFLFSGDVLK